MLHEMMRSARRPDDSPSGPPRAHGRDRPDEPREPTPPCLRADVVAAALERLPVGVVVADASGRTTYANEAARRLRATGAEPADGRSGPVAWATDLAMGRALLTGEVVRDEEVEYFAPSGRRWIRIDATPVRGASGTVEAAVLTVTDTTAERHEAAWAPVLESLARL